MAAVSKLIFHKEKLSETDIGARLAIPTRCLKDLPAFEEGKHFLCLKVNYKSMKKPSVFRCSKRQKGLYPKPVFDNGWVQFIRENDIRVGDSVSLLQEGADFKIEVKRKIILHGKVIKAPVP